MNARLTPHPLVPWPAQREAALRRLERADAEILRWEAERRAAERDLLGLAALSPAERPAADLPEYLSLSKAADRFSFNPKRLRSLIGSGEIEASREGRKVLVSTSSLRRYLALEAV